MNTTEQDPFARSPLHLTTANYVTDFWNDSCAVDELEYAMANGGVGATTNPSIVLNVLKKELPAWRGTPVFSMKIRPGVKSRLPGS